MEKTVNAHAKINLSLDLTGVLPNGYHAINTVMCTVGLCDTVTLKTGKGGISLRCSDVSLPADRKNTAYAAAELFFEEAGLTPDAQIYIEKRIPSQAGLGGGSADAAAVLNILNEMHGDILKREKLLEIALKTGADVPFAVVGGTALCLNTGEVLARLPQFSANVVIAKPERGVSTKEAYSLYDSGAPVSHPQNDVVLYYFARGEGRKALPYCGNVFEQLCFIPEGDGIKKTMIENGAYFVSLSGSGSAYFGLFESSGAAERAEKALKGTAGFVYSGKTC